MIVPGAENRNPSFLANPRSPDIRPDISGLIFNSSTSPCPILSPAKACCPIPGRILIENRFT